MTACKVQYTGFLFPTAWHGTRTVDPDGNPVRQRFSTARQCYRCEALAIEHRGEWRRCLSCGLIWRADFELPPTLEDSMVDFTAPIEVVKDNEEIRCSCGCNKMRVTDAMLIKSSHGFVYRMRCTTCVSVKTVVISEVR